MPEMDGIETLKAMKLMEDYPSKDTPVVILTANAIVGAKEQYLSEGFRAFLSKPIDPLKLEEIRFEGGQKETFESIKAAIINLDVDFLQDII